MQTVKPDKRVQFPQEVAPVDPSLATAVMNLADAIATGSSAKLGGMLLPDTKATLDILTSEGGWDIGVKDIEAVRVVGLDAVEGEGGKASAGTVFLAIQEPGTAYVLGWSGVNADGTWRFSASASTPETKRRASDFDGLGASVLGDAGAVASSSTASADAPPGATAADMTMSDIANALSDREFYVFVAASSKLSQGKGLPNSTEENLLIIFSNTFPTARTKFNAGKSSSTPLSGPQAGKLADMLVAADATASALLGTAPVTREQALAAIAEVLGIPVDQLTSPAAPKGPVPVGG
jgi:hypothetical protein